MSQQRVLRFWGGRNRAIWLAVVLAAVALPLTADLAWAQEPPQRDSRKQITHKMRMEAAERRKQMIQAIQARQKGEQQQQGGAGNQRGAHQGPSTNPGQ